ncbi:MAG: hypothetical protein A2623_12990 [Caulobacterales bacterium RIFCSPHIGHO2_01_FULL_70_19]|nr:MAG: hypothetical protein A2623_12990 [Caulobacterales bacterium RIFCSPHIGHO2_01_FULL_70_19]
MNWEWAPPTWEAAAILATGTGAVIGATWVGLRQASISERQAAISERQAEIHEHLSEIEALKVRADLFDRRQAVYRAANEWLSFSYAYGRVARPYTSVAETDVEELTDEEKTIAKDFRIAVHDSRFLFRPTVYEAMKLMREIGMALRRIDRSIASARRRAERKGEEANLDQLLDQQEGELDKLHKAGQALDKLFLPELNLGDLIRPPKLSEMSGDPPR